jgi:polysaccharide deacetylase/fibronectin type III domain protein
MTWPQVAGLAADGNEIAGHTLTHKRLPDVSATEQRRQICDDATNLRNQGHPVTSFAYPHGAGSTTANVLQALKDCGYKSARKVGGLRSSDCSNCPYAETIPPANPWAIRSNDWVTGPLTVSMLQSYVTQAEQHGGGWVPLMFHDLCTCGDSTISVSEFTRFLDWLKAREALGTVVKTVGEVIDGRVPPPPPAQRPAAPSLSATADSAVHLSWSAPADGGAPITGYNLYRGTSAGAETLLMSLGNVTSYDDTAVAGGTAYYYRLAATNAVGEGAQSNEAFATPTGSPPPPSAFPRTAVLDDFTRFPGGLGANWQSPGLADPGTVAILSSGVTASGAGASSATWKAGTFGADQEAYLTVPSLPKAGSFMQVAGRVSTLSAANVSCYLLRVTPSTSSWELRKKLNGGGSTSMKTFKAPFAAGDALGLQIIGSTITAYRKPSLGGWTSLGSTSDTAITGAGYVSFTLADTTVRGGAFGGGAVN